MAGRCEGLAAGWSSFSWLWCSSPDTKLTKHGAKHLVETLKSCPVLCLKSLSCEYNLADYDATLPDDIKRRNYKDGNKALLQYYRDRLSSGSSTVSRFRLLIVGDGGAGKTTLARRLQQPDTDPGVTPVTHGIETGTFTILDGPDGKPMKATVTDFGGQQQYRRTHPVLFTDKAVYLVVWSPRADQTTTLASVRRYVRQVSTRAPGAPIVLVETHAGEGMASLVSASAWATLHGEHACVMGSGVVRVDGRTGVGVAELTAVVKSAALTLAHVPEREVPARYVLVRFFLVLVVTTVCDVVMVVGCAATRG